MPKAKSYTCPFCGSESHNPHDAKELYCGRCHQFAGDALQILDLTMRLAEERVSQGRNPLGSVTLPISIAKLALKVIRRELENNKKATET